MWRRGWFWVIAVAIGGWGGAGTAAYGQSGQLIERVSGSQMQKLVQSWGYRADLSTDNDGDPIIRTAMSGANVNIVFYNCTKEGIKICDSVQLSAGFNTGGRLAPAKINEWNQKQRYLKSFLDKDSDPFVQYDVLLAGGIAVGNLREIFKKYETNLGNFMSFIDFKK